MKTEESKRLNKILGEGVRAECEIIKKVDDFMLFLKGIKTVAVERRRTYGKMGLAVNRGHIEEAKSLYSEIPAHKIIL